MAVIGPHIGCAETVYPRPARPDISAAENVALRTWVHHHVIPDFSKPIDPESPPVPVAIVRGCWRVRCPFCGATQIASATDRKMLCVECINHPINGRWLRVIWPPAKAARQACALLLRRPVPNQNMLPGESIADLEMENREHGL